MKKLWLLAFRNLWARKTRTLVTASGILLGVAAMLAVSVMGSSTTQSLKDFFAQSSGRAHLTIADSGSSGEGFPQRALRRARSFAGVATAAGLTNNRAVLLAEDKEAAIVVVGIDPAVDRRVRTYTMASGQFLSPRERTHTILLVARFAADHGVGLDDTITITLADGAAAEFVVKGLLADEGAARTNGGSVGFVTLDVAEAVFARGNRLDQIDLVAQPAIADSAARLNELKDKLQSMLGDKYVVSFPAATGESVSQALSGLNIGLGIFSAIALFVGMLLIYNTFAMTVAERTREIGMMRTLGATRRQVLLLTLGEAGFLGVIGTALGLGGGLLLSIPLIRLMGSMMGLPMESFAIPSGGLIQAVVVGLITTLVAAFIPAWHASRISPTEAMRARAGGRERFLMRHGWKFGLALLALAALDGAGLLPLGEGASFFVLTFLGAILLMPNIILLLERAGRRAIAVLYGPMGQLGSRNLARAKGRTSLTVGVMMIGVVMNVAIGAMSVSFKASMNNWINAAIGGDFIVSSAEPMRADVGRELLAVVTPQRLLQQTVVGVANESGYTKQNLSVGLLGIDPATYYGVSSFQFGGGEDAAAAMAELARGNAVLISTALRDRWQARPGDTVRLRTSRGELDFRIAGTVVSFWQGGQVILTTRRDLEKYFGDTRVTFFLLKMKPGQSSATVEARLEEALKHKKQLDVVSGDEFRQSFATQILQFFALFDAMVWIAVIVGTLGVINTMTMNILERVREIGTLRSIGLSRRQLAQLVLAEAGAMGALGAVFGAAVALPVSTVMVTGMAQGSGFQMSYVFPREAFVTGMIIALIVSQVAALYPTWRAGRINVIEAIRSE
ncbi:MAG: ABC transporter permease [Chloroflexi bacterium]|nr:ABC transporter permease [Chloroflexota bacterium]